MKKLRLNALLAGLLGIFALAACNKDDVEPYDFQKYLDTEEPILERYVDSLVERGEIDETYLHFDQRGIWFELLNPGDGSYVYNFDTLSNQQIVIQVPKMTVKYTGKLLNGAQFDTNKNPGGDTFTVNNVIAAWMWAFLPKKIESEDIGELSGLTDSGLSKGAVIRIITPSPYGYQNQTQNGIPANSPLDFQIEVVDVAKQIN